MARRHLSNSLGHRADQAGLLVAGGNLPLTFQRTLMPRPTMDQAIVTGLSVATNHAFVALVQESIQAAALLALRRGHESREDQAAWSRATIAADLAAVGVGIALQRLLPQRHREPLPRAAARTSGFFLSVTGTAAAIIGGLQELAAKRTDPGRFRIPPALPAATALALAGEVRRRRADRLDRDLPPSETKVSPLKALGYGAAISAALSAVGLGERTFASAVARAAARVLPFDEEVLRPIGHALALAGLGLGTRALVEQAFHRIESKETSVEAAFDIPPPNPLVSGSFDSKVHYDTLSRQGGRFVWMVTPREKIAELMGEVDAPPIRVYVGLKSAGSEEERVALVMDELERTQAFERQWILVDSPTGTGYVNYAAVNALEVLARGNCASVAMQYAARPSVLSLDRVEEGRRQARLLLAALHQRLEGIPAERRPKLVLFGESLGAWSSQDPFVDRGTSGLVNVGVDHSIWIGTPHFSKWKEQVLYDDRPDVDHDLVGVFNHIDEWNALPHEERDRIRYVMITHHNDGVALFGPELAIRAPEWLGPAADRPSSVPKGMRWVPTTTFFQVLVDMKNSATVVPGQFAATGHDYRADLLPFFNAALGFDASNDQLDRIGDWLEQNELRRTTWIKEHGTAGRSLAVSIVEVAMEELREQGVDCNERLVQLIGAAAERELGAGGGATEATTGTTP